MRSLVLPLTLSLSASLAACAAYSADPPPPQMPAPAVASASPASAASSSPEAPTASSSAPAASSEPVMEMLPAPYTAAQIRDATHAGRVYDYRVEKVGAPPVHLIMKMTSVSADGADVESRITDDQGKLVDGPRSERGRWEDFQKHGEFPKAFTVTRDDSTQVPAGKYACTVFVVTQGDVVSTFYFAKNQPGPPVLFYTDKGGQRVMTSTLTRYSDGNH